MLVRTDEKIPIARLLTFLEHGERLAHTCAKAQAALAIDAGHRRFFLSQARQESMHALVFQGAIAWLAPKYFVNTPILPALEEYRKLLSEALARKDLIETVLAEQVILEGLGEAILNRVEAGLVKRAAPYGRLRRILLHQEEAHHAFGQRMLERAMADGHIDAVSLCRNAERYLELVERMVLTQRDLFESIAEDPAAWAADVKTFLPPWLAPQSPNGPKES
jgi:hypothetical protein